jgi:uncharacterized membrane protein
MSSLSLSHIPADSPWWVFVVVAAGLAAHIGGGSLGVLSGYGAVSARKGEHWHRLFGKVFVASMMIMAVAAASLAFWINQKANIAGGILAFYLVATAWVTVKREEAGIGPIDYALPFLAAGVAGAMLTWGVEAAASPTGTLDGGTPALYYVFGTFAAFAALLDMKVILQGGLSGTPRIARHLWRMCVALFFAAGSFFLGQQKVMPHFMRGSPLLFVPAFAPLALMVFWLVRIRVGNSFRRRATAKV